MDRIKQLREQSKYTQSELADMLGTTQQTVGRWEKGQSEPNIQTLKDLALIFGTSVDDLLGTNPLSDKPISTHLMRNYGGESAHDAFWGNIGIRLPNSVHTKWYPITESEKTRIRNCLSSERTWILITTLNNRALAVNLKNISRLWLLDDNADQPSDDWVITQDEYNGMPMEIYKGMDSFLNNSDDWHEDTSVKFREIVKNQIDKLELNNEELFKKLHYTTVHTKGSDSFSYWAAPENIQQLFFDSDSDVVESLVQISSVDLEYESFFHETTLALVEMPLIDIIDLEKELYKDL
jgi:transcriptional regulator with XRE-family HTH domain